MIKTSLLIPMVLCFVSYFTTACHTPSGKETADAPKIYSLSKVDSFQVDNFTRITIRDYSVEEGIYLGYSSSEDAILEISSTGEIKKRVSRKGEGPNLYGNRNPIGMSFGPDNLRIIELPFRIITYDKDYNEVHANGYITPLPIRANMPIGTTPYYTKADSTFLLIGPSNYLSANYLIYTQEGKDTLQNFYQMHLESGNTKSVIPYESNSVYSSDKIHFERMGKTFAVNNESNELYLLHDLEKRILIYELEGLKLKREIPITHSEFIQHSPLPIETSSGDERVAAMKNNSGKNMNLIHLGKDLLMIRYFTGITEGQFDARNSEEKPYIPYNDPLEQRIILIKDGKQVDGELPGISGNIIIPLPDHKILVQEFENKEIEEEFTRFGIYQLKTE